MINLRVQAPEMKQNVLAPRITVVGVGGAGGNAINNMITTGLDGVEFVVCNTDAQSLAGGRAGKKIQLGANITGGLGAGAKPDVGRAAAEESLDDVMAHIEGSNMVFITSGMGGGTGTGAAPVIARACREAGILTVGVVTKPFHFEGPVRMKAAEEGIREMQQYVDTLIVIPNQNLFRIANEKTTFGDAFKLADSVLQSAVRGVTDLMIMPGLVNLDFNDIKTTMTEMGKAMMGTGEASGDRRAVLASEAAISNPLLDDVTLKGAKGVIINIAGGNDMTLYEIDEACNRIRTEVDADANIIFGTSIDESLQGSLRVTVLATGIEAEADRKARDDTRSRRMMGQQPVSNMRTGETREAAAASAATARPYAAAVSIEETTFTAPISAPAAELPTTMPYIQGQAFIPPAPVEAEVGTASAATVSYNRILSGVPGPKMGEELAPLTLSAPEVAVSMSAVPAPAPAEIPTDLAIPASMVPAAPTRRAPSMTQEPALSLFQRITNRVRRTVEVAFEDSSASEPAYQAQYVASTRGTSAVSAQPLPAAAREPVDVARPAKAPSPQAELDLDIPAFLRRQAS